MTWAQASDSGQILTCAFGPRRTQWTSGMGLRIKSSSAALDMARRGVRIQTRRTPRRAISGPLTPVTSGQSRSSVNNEPPSSATLTAMRHTPSKLVMRVRFPSPALMVSPQVSGILRFFLDTSTMRVRGVVLRARWLWGAACFLGPGIPRLGEEPSRARRYLLVTLAGGVLVDECGARAPRSRSRRM